MVEATGMDWIVLYIIGGVGLLSWLWLNALASLSVRYDRTLDPFQRIFPAVVVWAVPYLGARFVPHLIWQHYPEAIPNGVD